MTARAIIEPGHRFLFTPPQGKDTEYVVAHAEKGMGPSGIVKLHRLDVTPERERDYAQVTEHWLRKPPPGYSGYWTFIEEESS